MFIKLDDLEINNEDKEPTDLVQTYWENEEERKRKTQFARDYEKEMDKWLIEVKKEWEYIKKN